MHTHLHNSFNELWKSVNAFFSRFAVFFFKFPYLALSWMYASLLLVPYAYTKKSTEESGKEK